MSGLRRIYLVLAVLGAVIPMYHLVTWWSAMGPSPQLLLQAWAANAAVRAVTWDLLITGAALTVWILAEVSVSRNWRALWALPACYLIGVSCALPLYLFLRTRRV